MPVFEHLTQIAHVEPSLAAGTFHKVIGFTLRDIIGITSAFGTFQTSLLWPTVTLRHKRSLAFEVWNGCPSFDISTPPGCDEWQGQYPEQWLMDGVFRRAREGNIVVRLTCAGTAGMNGPSSTRRVQTLRRLALPSPIYRCSVGSAEKRRLDF